MKFLSGLEEWPEITQIRVGQLRSRNVSGRAAKQIVIKPAGDGTTVLKPKQDRKNARGGGDFSFKATRWAMLGSRITGIKCDASQGTNVQEVILMSSDLDALKRRLIADGLCTGEW
jgi:hypothetical protein